MKNKVTKKQSEVSYLTEWGIISTPPPKNVGIFKLHNKIDICTERKWPKDVTTRCSEKKMHFDYDCTLDHNGRAYSAPRLVSSTKSLAGFEESRKDMGKRGKQPGWERNGRGKRL